MLIGAGRVCIYRGPLRAQVGTDLQAASDAQWHLLSRVSVPRKMLAKPRSIQWGVGPRDRYGKAAGEENGLSASTTNMTKACRSLVPVLETSIAFSAPCPASPCPAATFMALEALRMLCSPDST